MKQQELIEAIIDGTIMDTTKSLSSDGERLICLNTAIDKAIEDKR